MRIVIHEKYSTNDYEKSSNSETGDSVDNDELNRSERIVRILIHKCSSNEY